MPKIDPVLYERLDKLISSMGYELVRCEMSSSRRESLFRIYIDKPNGVSVDDCQAVSQQVSALFNVEDPMPGKYLLEVSSPGLDRPLTKLEHFEKQVGKRIKLHLKEAVDGHNSVNGTLQCVQAEMIHVLIDESGKEMIVPFSNIEKANIVGEIPFKNKPVREH